MTFLPLTVSNAFEMVVSWKMISVYNLLFDYFIVCYNNNNKLFNVACRNPIK